MKFKVDENLPADLADLLRSAGHDAITVANQNLSGSVRMSRPNRWHPCFLPEDYQRKVRQMKKESDSAIARSDSSLEPASYAGMNPQPYPHLAAVRSCGRGTNLSSYR